jgi:rare lipoprotein A
MRKTHAWALAVFAMVGIAASPDRRKGGAPFPIVFGNASWYGWWHEGRLTASGVRFHASVESAASVVLPLGTWVRITNLENGRFAVVKVTDRGPYIRGRVIDVSWATAVELGMLKAGIVRVKVEPMTGEVDHRFAGSDKRDTKCLNADRH